MRISKWIGVLLLCVPILGCAAPYSGPLKEGDIVFQSLGENDFGRAIELATHSRFSHVGLVLMKSGRPYVYEGVGPVKFTPLEKWIAQGEGGHYVARRLKEADKVLTPSTLKKMEEVALSFKGKHYDWTFEWSDDKIYCSELVWKVYQRATGLEVGKTQKLKEFDFSNPLVKQQLQEKYGTSIPWNETVISPETMFRSDLLMTVTEK